MAFAQLVFEIGQKGVIVGTVDGTLQLVGDAGQSGYHHQHFGVFAVGAFAHQVPDGVPAMALRHRGPAEFQHDPIGSRGGFGHGGRQSASKDGFVYDKA